MERVTVQEASNALGMTPHAVRLLMQQGQLDIGYVIRQECRCTYLIYKDLLDAEVKRIRRKR
jgi:hypothetical protein